MFLTYCFICNRFLRFYILIKGETWIPETEDSLDTFLKNKIVKQTIKF